MNTQARNILLGCLLGMLVINDAQAQTKALEANGKLSFVESVTKEDLASVNFLCVSPDGKFLFATPWSRGAICVFKLDAQTGKPELVETLMDDNLKGNTSAAFGKKDNLLVAPAFQAKTLVLMKWDPAARKLKVLDVARQGENDVDGLDFAIKAVFSTDGNYIYALDGGQGGVTAFKVAQEKLTWIETTRGKYANMRNSRGIAAHPDGKTLFVANSDSGTLVVLDRDEENGRTSVRQTLWDEKDGIHGLSGVFGAVSSQDGHFVYTSSGRFRGDNAVSAFRYGEDGKLTLLQEFLADKNELGEFKGGHYIALSPDGLNVYVSATESGSVACFMRNAQTGKLQHFETLVHHENERILAGAAGIACSPDGKFVYVASEFGNSITVFRRNR